MKIKKEYIILAVIIVALGSYLFFRQSDRVHYSIPNLPAVDTGAISKIELITKSGTITLDKKGDAWFVGPGEFPADLVKVERMLMLIGSLTLTDMVSESENYSRYELTDEDRITVKAYAGKDLSRSFHVGKTATSYRHTYVMVGSDTRVYQAKEDFRDDFLADMNELRNRKVLSFDRDEIRKMHIARGAGELALTRQEIKRDGEKAGKDTVKWTDREGREVPTADADTLVSSLSSLECEAFLEDFRKEDLKSPDLTVTLTGTKDLTLSVYPKQDEGVPAVCSENPYVFMLPEYVQEEIGKAVQSLMSGK